MGVGWKGSAVAQAADCGFGSFSRARAGAGGGIGQIDIDLPRGENGEQRGKGRRAVRPLRCLPEGETPAPPGLVVDEGTCEKLKTSQLAVALEMRSTQQL